MKHKISSMFALWFLIIYLEMVYKIFIFSSFFDLTTIYVIVFSSLIALFLGLITNLYSKKLNYILHIIVSFLITLLYASQVVYYNFYGSIFSIFSLKNGTIQILDFMSAIIEVMFRVWYILVILFIPFVIFAVFSKKTFSFNKLKVNAINLILAIIIGLCLIVNMIIKKDNDGIYSLNRLYYETHAPILTTNKIGLITMIKLDLNRYIFGFEEKIFKKNIDRKETEEVEKKDYNLLDIDFKGLISEEENQTIKDMHEYFSNVIPSEKNDYTSKFKGKNLIYITAEGFDTIAIDEVLTPTLYKMSNNGIVFKNFYQPIFPVSTSDGEYMFMNSLIPKEGVWSMYQTSFISMPFALGNMFKELGYKTNAYHNHTYTYYNRYKSHPNLGFEYLGCGNGLEKRMNCRNWPNSDLEMIEGTYYDYINENTQNFATYYMTVSGHLNYTFGGNNMSNKNKELVKDMPYSERVKAYVSCNVELDRAMEALLRLLKEANVLDDTLIVIAPDHYPYGLEINEINEKSQINRADKFDLYKTTLIMYNSVMEKVTVEKTASSIDVLPTVYNLFGLEFDSRLLMGRDLLSESEGLAILSDRSWITDKGRYNAITKDFLPVPGANVEEGYIDSINSEVYQKFSMSSLILSHDYYNQLGL